jgi:hypothetical protein
MVLKTSFPFSALSRKRRENERFSVVLFIKIKSGHKTNTSIPQLRVKCKEKSVFYKKVHKEMYFTE